MKKIFSLICIMMFCIAMSSCVSSYAIDDYYTGRRCYHTNSVYYRDAHRHQNNRPNPNLYRYEPRPKHHPKSKPQPHPHSYRPYNSK